MQGFGDESLQGGNIHRFEQVIIGPEFHGSNGGFGRPVGGEEDHRQLSVQRLDLLQDFQPSEARQLDIEQDQMGFLQRQLLQGLLAGGGADDSERLPERPLQ
jgi:hypothetical protein